VRVVVDVFFRKRAGAAAHRIGARQGRGEWGNARRAIFARFQPDCAHGAGAADAVHGGVGPAGGAARPGGWHLRSLGVSAEDPDDFSLSFQTPAYAEPIPGATLATAVDVRPEGVRIRYTHAAFTVDAIWLVPLEQPGAIVLLDVDSSVPLSVLVRFRPDLKPMWPAALGGQYSFWDGPASAYVVGEASRRQAALVGSPVAAAPPEQPAHNLPDQPLQFRIEVTPEHARAGLVPIAMAATAGGVEEARKAYARLLRDPGADWRESRAHYERLRAELTSIDTPDDSIDLAFAWGKVALDKGFVCNPHLGCGQIAGLGPSGTTERPGFGWFFGGDTFMNAWAMTAYGDIETVRRSLEFLRTHQRADGKMPHEISQGAGYVRWFEDFPYAYYHADTTPLYITAVADWVRVTGDLEVARAFWPSVQRAYAYCVGTDEDGDGLMDNTKAGLAAVETGTLRSRDVLTDVYLAAAWTDATAGMAYLAGALGQDAQAETARDAHRTARSALGRRFAGATEAGIPFAVMRDGTLQGASTVWPAVGLWRGGFEPGRPAVERTLDLLAGHGLAADWGARMVTRESLLYDPLSYNNGAIWPFVTGFAALALYEHGRPEAGWAYVSALGELAFIESRGYTAELFSGDRLRSVDAAVPHQLFASSGFVSGLLRGTLGFDAGRGQGEAGDRLLLRPTLPAHWDQVTVRNLRWRGHRVHVRLSLERSGGRARGYVVELTADPGPVPVRLELPLPPGARPERLTFEGELQGTATWRPRIERQGYALAPLHEPLVLGQPSTRLRIIDTVVRDGHVIARVVGRRSRSYAVDLHGPDAPAGLTGARVISRDAAPGRFRLEVVVPAGPGEWGDAEIRIPIGYRR
jgi:glycogen debranching enzyme